jgi:hypothetical protein
VPASITLTVDTYGKWLPMGNKAPWTAWMTARSLMVVAKIVAGNAAASKSRPQVVDLNGDPGRARTFNPEIKSLLLYH